jgi:hypothetical protein
MSMRADLSAPDDAQIEIRRGRQAASWTDVRDWVALACTHQDAPTRCCCTEVAWLYWVLCMHLNRKRGDKLVWPSMDALARISGRSRGDKVTPWVARLVELGAVDVERVRERGGRYVFTVHQEPPRGYAGPTSLGQWYAVHRDALDSRRERAANLRQDRRMRTKGLVSCVPPEPGEHHVTPVPGEPVTPEPGEPVTPVPGGEPKRTEPPEREPHPPAAPTPTVPGPDTSARNGGGGRHPEAEPPDPLDALVDELHAMRPDWRRPAIAAAVLDEIEAGVAAEVVAAAARLCYAEPDTAHPGRLRLRGEIGWWWRPERRPPDGEPAPAWPEWCGECSPDTRLRVRRLDVIHDAPYRCPECHPLAGGRALVEAA